MFEHLSRYYFTNVAMLVASLIVIVIGAMNFKTLKRYNLLIIYSIFSFLQVLFAVVIYVYNPYNLHNSPYYESSMNLFMLVEFLIFNWVIWAVIYNRWFKLVMQMLMVFFVLLVLHNWVFEQGFFKYVAHLSVIELFLILIACLFYFVERFSSAPVKNSSTSDFWIISGILVLSATIIPIISISQMSDFEYKQLSANANSIIFLAYICLYGFFTIGLICKTKETSF